jgi:hypothetical protein
VFYFNLKLKFLKIYGLKSSQNITCRSILSTIQLLHNHLKCVVSTNHLIGSCDT